ncbi:MAG: hypothetical protein MZW92_09945 [Comamonadaceae bacterium]|nr:hypothetical protein [Comamonadaceae bacterium]
MNSQSDDLIDEAAQGRRRRQRRLHARWPSASAPPSATSRPCSPGPEGDARPGRQLRRHRRRGRAPASSRRAPRTRARSSTPPTPRVAPFGTLVRTNFAFTSPDPLKGGGFIRFERISHLVEAARGADRLDARFILQEAARDLVHEKLHSYPLVRPLPEDPAEPLYVNTNDTDQPQLERLGHRLRGRPVARAGRPGHDVGRPGPARGRRRRPRLAGGRHGPGPDRRRRRRRRSVRPRPRRSSPTSIPTGAAACPSTSASPGCGPTAARAWRPSASASRTQAWSGRRRSSPSGR